MDESVGGEDAVAVRNVSSNSDSSPAEGEGSLSSVQKMNTRARMRSHFSSEPLWFARWCIQKTWWVLLGLFLVPLLAAGVIAFTRSFELAEQTTNDYLIWSNEVVLTSKSLEAARIEIFDGTKDDVVITPLSISRSSYTVYLMYHARNGDADEQILTPDRLSAVKGIEDSFRFEFFNYTSHCWFDQSFVNCDGTVPKCALPYTVLQNPDLYGELGISQDNESYVCDIEGPDVTAPVSSDELNRAIDAMFLPDGSVNPAYSFTLGVGFNESSRNTAYLRSTFPMGSPLEGYINPNDNSKKQRDQFENWVVDVVNWAADQSTDEMEVIVFNSQYQQYIFGDLANKAFVWAIGSVIFVLILMWVHTSSFYLAIMGMLQILLAFPVTYFLYYFVFRVTYFSSMHILTVFLILGIGADDIFVFIDAWHQAEVILGRVGDLQRLSWTFRRASRAMMVTSFTTAAAFYITASSEIMPISTFGVFAGTLILVNYLMCILMFPCNLIVWHRFWRQRHWRACLRKVPEPEEDEHSPTKENETELQYRPVERFFRGPWNSYMRKMRFVHLGVAVALIGVCIWLATKLEPLTEDEEWIPDSHESMRAGNWMNDNFLVAGTTTSYLRVDLSWGIAGLDRSDTNKYDPSDIGTVIWDDDFSLLSAANQQAVLDTCNVLGSNMELVSDREGSVRCWIIDFDIYQRTIKPGTPGLISYESDAALAAAVEEFLYYNNSAGTQPYIKYVDSEQVGIETMEGGSKKLRFFFFRFQTDHRRSLPYEVMFPVYEQWATEIEKINSESPQGVNNALVSGGDVWPFMITQNTLVDNSFLGMGLAIMIAFCALLVSTLNVLVSVISTLAVGSIVVSVLACMYLYGWMLGIIETIAAVIIVGFSVDYVVHIGNAYVESSHDQRADRARDALTDMGISVLFGALTTAGAGAFLFGPVLVFFPKFGALLMTTIAFSFLWSMVFFVSVLHICGPNGDFGNLRPPLTRFWKKITASCTCCAGVSCCCGSPNSGLDHENDEVTTTEVNV